MKSGTEFAINIMVILCIVCCIGLAAAVAGQFTLAGYVLAYSLLAMAVVVATCGVSSVVNLVRSILKKEGK